jgi:hypothetical protein
MYVMATGAPGACGRSSQAAYPTLCSISKKLVGRGVEPPFVFGSRTKGGSTSLAMTAIGNETKVFWSSWFYKSSFWKLKHA